MAEPTSEIRSRSGPGSENDLTGLRHALLQGVLNANVNAGSPSSPPQSPLALAQATLDQRMLSLAPNPREAARLEGMLRPLLNSPVLGEATAELGCGATLCKVTLIAEDDAGATRAATQLSDRLPKVFSSAVVYPESSGRRALYVSTNPADLELTPAPAVVARRGTQWE